MESIQAGSFCFGMFYGLIAAGIIGLIASRMREARIKIAHKDRSYDNFPISVQPNLTASDVVRTSTAESLLFTALFIILIVFIGLTLAGAYYIVQS
jgi:hypothetical protein